MQLSRNAGWAIAPLVGLCLAFGKLGLALSFAAGALLSLVMGVLLQQFVQRLVSTVTGKGPASSSTLLQFAGWMLLKFAFAVGACILLVLIKGLSIFAVLAGVVIGQVAVAVTAAKHNKLTTR